MSESTPHPTHNRIESLATLVQELLTELATRGKTPELPTGIPMLDETIWGLHRNELTIISARPGEGKTTLALQIGRHLAEQHKKVMFVSMEMTRHQIVERLLVQLTQCDAWNLRVGQGYEELTQRIAPLMADHIFDRMNMRIVDRIGYTIPQMQHLLSEMVNEGGGAPDLLIVDFIQLVRLEGTMQRFDAIAEYLLALKELAMRYNMAVLCCSQLNREAKKTSGAPKLEQMKGSGAIEELADCVISCWWEELGTEEKPQGYKYWLVINKNRYGSPGDRIPVRFDMKKLTFHAVDNHVEEWTLHADPRTE